MLNLIFLVNYFLTTHLPSRKGWKYNFVEPRASLYKVVFYKIIEKIMEDGFSRNMASTPYLQKRKNMLLHDNIPKTWPGSIYPRLAKEKFATTSCVVLNFAFSNERKNLRNNNKLTKRQFYLLSLMKSLYILSFTHLFTMPTKR